MLITFGFLYSLGGSLFESDKVETEDKILYLEPKGVIVTFLFLPDNAGALDLLINCFYSSFFLPHVYQLS